MTSVDYDAAEGELYVGFQNSLPAEGQNRDGNEEINVVALSYTEKDGTTARTVVSDYARVVADMYSKLRIGKVSEDVIAPEFLKKAGEANLKELDAPEKEERTFTVLNMVLLLSLQNKYVLMVKMVVKRHLSMIMLLRTQN